MAKATKKEISANENKDEALELGLQQIQKQYGKGCVVFGSGSAYQEIERIPTGSISLDRALTGGYARGRIIEITGPESAGKTTLTLHAIVECQKQGGKCAFVDVEHAFDSKYAQNIGVNMDQIVFSQPDSAEQALNIVEMLIRTNAISLIVVDSVAALVPEKEIEGEVGSSVIGLQARLMSQAMRKFASIAHNSNTTIIFLNQIRMKIGVLFGSPEVGAGGQALKYYASQRLDIRRTGAISSGEDKTGISCRVKVTKSKVGPPFKQAEFNIMFGTGIDFMTDLVTVAVAQGIINKAGAWYSYKEERIGQGEKNAAKTIEENEKIRNEILKELNERTT